MLLTLLATFAFSAYIGWMIGRLIGYMINQIRYESMMQRNLAVLSS
jgi:hypothetical protein